ncbi:hypothetical protein TREMEDRAFT_25267, partial [Tremella mesenterica DSM 1558]|uniref:uncharacterized protein n=1 Tax=Tremella mesenterica (strain ATCC 24925 / CBS 8224 / DSM 1558 / NBRC 9311 / NRRL Y-6157 / RJB 2259-6 / UBC 559-6) TaxID=578456 RepID=UPI0003F48D5E
VEVRLLPYASVRPELIPTAVRALIESGDNALLLGPLTEWEHISILQRNVEQIIVAEFDPPVPNVLLRNAHVNIHLYRPVNISENLAAELDGDDQESVSAATIIDLPAQSLEGLWENLIYPPPLKSTLLNMVRTSMVLGDLGVNPNIVALNRLVLLHGPPGTGKTSLCRALAQKLSIRLSDTYAHGKLVEINSHSLFSKWFSESGKLVQKLFSSVMEMVEREDCFVVVLIDEVESLTIARDSFSGASEPGDALRVVNALLTQLDKLRSKTNVLVLTTSNLSHTIVSDKAFIDRADIKEYVPPPIPEAIYWILRTTLVELMNRGLVQQLDLPLWNLIAMSKVRAQKGEAKEGQKVGIDLARVAQECHSHGLSGRFLRRIPALALAIHFRGRTRPRSCERWVEAFFKVIENEVSDRRKIAREEVSTIDSKNIPINLSPSIMSSGQP